MAMATHDELVHRAARWLRNSAVVFAGYERPDGRPARVRARCSIVLAEPRSSSSEIPDAIGWFCGGRFSVLIEAKSTLSNFLADRSKRFRRHPEQGMGRYRYYLTPPGLVHEKDLPDAWGLLECHPKRMAVVRLAALQIQHKAEAEVQVLHAVLRRERAIRSLAVRSATSALPGAQPAL